MVLIQKNIKKINKRTTLEKIQKMQSQASASASKTKEKSKPAAKKESPVQKKDNKEVKK